MNLLQICTSLNGTATVLLCRCGSDESTPWTLHQHQLFGKRDARVRLLPVRREVTMPAQRCPRSQICV